MLIADGKGRVLLGGRPAQLPGRAYAPRRDQRLSGSRECLAVREHDRELRGGHGVHPAGRKQVLPVRDVDDTVGVRGGLLERVTHRGRGGPPVRPVEGQRARPSAVMRFDLLNVVGSRPARRASPEAERLARAARRSMADQTCAWVSIIAPLMPRR